MALDVKEKRKVGEEAGWEHCDPSCDHDLDDYLKKAGQGRGKGW